MVEVSPKLSSSLLQQGLVTASSGCGCSSGDLGESSLGRAKLKLGFIAGGGASTGVVVEGRGSKCWGDYSDTEADLGENGVVDGVLEELRNRIQGVFIYPVCAILEEGIFELKDGLRQLMNDGESNELSLKSIVMGCQ
ncbi:hypothetical protein Droror1_Dr00006351 [Drosera rotundifolia]